MNEFDLEAQGKQNKAIRGYIMRLLVKGAQCRMPVKQISNVLTQAGMIINPDISKYLDYLKESGYIEFTGDKISAYNAYAKDGVIKITRKGTDLIEQTIDDNGVDI